MHNSYLLEHCHKPGQEIAVASAGNKILFAGGHNSLQTIPSSVVDIYDISTQTWSTTQLSIARYGIAAIAAGNKVYFAGGRSLSLDSPSSRIDIYDVVSNTWSIAQLSEPRLNTSTATVGNKIMFAGVTRFIIVVIALLTK
jgi:hypothetical protein